MTPAGTSAAGPRLPRQIRYIIGNEACERFSFYGMRNILTVFLVDHLLRAYPTAERAAVAKEIFHLFVMAVFFFPLLGGWLADRYWGKYRTIFWLSLVYCAGHACLALFDDRPGGFYFGLFLIALGSGGIKACVSAFVGDQFTAENKSLLPKIYGAFYWTINLGSLVASLTIPKVLKAAGPAVAFGIPGALMGLATLIFWLGRRHYRELPPAGPDPHGFLRVVAAAVRARRAGHRGRLLDGARGAHPEAAIDGARAVLGVLRVFLPIPFFWMLFDQKASAWVLQARRMDLSVGPFTFEPAQLQFINPALVLVLVPLCAGVVYPAFARWGLPLSPLRRMTIGMFLAAGSFVWVAAIERAIEAGAYPSVLWQAGPYLLLTLGEVFVSVTGLEFAYAQAPRAMKGTIMSFWMLTTTVGNLGVVLVSKLNVFQGAGSFLFYAALVAAAGGALALLARGFVERDYFRDEARAG